MVGRIAPRRVGDDVTVFAQERLDDGKQPRMGDCLLRGGAAVQHGVAEHRGIVEHRHRRLKDDRAAVELCRDDVDRLARRHERERSH